MNTEKQEEVKENGQVTLRENGSHIHLLSIIGEIEGHECAPASAKTTKYEHVLPQLAAIEDDPDIEGLLILINTVGGDISAGLALAEMIASLSLSLIHICPGSHLVMAGAVLCTREITNSLQRRRMTPFGWKPGLWPYLRA